MVSKIQVRWPRRYGWDHVGLLADPIRDGICAHVRLELEDIPQPEGNIVVFEFIADGTRITVGVDTEDRPVLHPVADDLPLVFKLEHARDGYGRANVVPGGYTTTRHRTYELFPRFRALREGLDPAMDVYGRFSLWSAPEVRRRAVAMLSQQTDLTYEGGTKLVLWHEYMREACAARVCLDLPGRGPMSCRLIEYLAVGCAILAPLHGAVLHVPLVADEHIAYAREDLSDLVDVAKRYAGDEGARRRISEGAQRFFDAYLRPEQLGAYYLTRCLQAIA